MLYAYSSVSFFPNQVSDVIHFRNMQLFAWKLSMRDDVLRPILITMYGVSRVFVSDFTPTILTLLHAPQRLGMLAACQVDLSDLPDQVRDTPHILPASGCTVYPISCRARYL